MGARGLELIPQLQFCLEPAVWCFSCIIWWINSEWVSNFALSPQPSFLHSFVATLSYPEFQSFRGLSSLDEGIVLQNEAWGQASNDKWRNRVRTARVGPRMRQGGKSHSKEMSCYEWNFFWRTRYWCVLHPFFLGLQYPQAQKSAHLGILKSKKYGSYVLMWCASCQNSIFVEIQSCILLLVYTGRCTRL